MKLGIATMALLVVTMPAAAQSQAQINATAGTAYRAADAAMTREWRATYARMKARDAGDTTRGGGFGYAAAALASQRAWLAYRDAQCVIEGGEFAGGTLMPMTITMCRTNLTQGRAAQLRVLRWSQP